MAAVFALCVRLINRKVYTKERITYMVNTYHRGGYLTKDELDELLLLIEEEYAEN